MMTISRWAAWLLCGALTTAAGAQEQGGTDYFKGKSVRVIVGYAPGGGYDVYARLLVEHLPKYLPGAQTVIQYMPGAATELAAGYIMDVAPQDGTVIGIPVSTLPIATYVTHKPGEGIDVAALQWIGRLDAIDAVAAVWHTAGVSNLKEAQAKQLVFGGTSPTGSSFMVPQALSKLKKLNLKIVMGYNGTTDAYLAMERGEIDGMTNAIWSQLKRTKPDWFAGRKFNVLYQQPEKRAADLADVPTLVDLGANEDEKRVFRLLSSESTVGRAFYVGPKVPADRVAALRRAFTAMSTSPAFRQAADSLQVTIDPMTGEDMQKLITDISKYPPDVFQRARDLTAP